MSLKNISIAIYLHAIIPWHRHLYQRIILRRDHAHLRSLTWRIPRGHVIVLAKAADWQNHEAAAA